MFIRSKAVPTMTVSLFGLFASPQVDFAQAPPTTQTQGETPVFRVDVVEYAERTTKAISYRNRSGATKIDFEGTPLLEKANGEAKVESKQGYTEIEVEFDDLAPAVQFGPEYLTYVLWAITPEGRANNLGELLLNGDRAKLNVTTELQSFSLLVTAEPYFAVTQPSDVVVLENVVRSDTQGTTQPVEAKFELLKHGTYAKNVQPGMLEARRLDKRTPLELLEADNAIVLARAAGAERFAKDTLEKAVDSLSQAQKYASQASNRKPAIAAARQAVQMAEDARLITLQRQEEARLTEERRLAEARTTQANMAAAEAAARARSEAEARLLAEADAQRAAQDRARAEAERSRAEAEKSRAAALASEATARAEAEARARQAAEETAKLSAAAKAEADAARQAAEKARAEAEIARVAAVREADRLASERLAAEAAREQAQREATEARAMAAKADQERAELRDRLQQQLTVVLETKQTARGLIVNMSDVLFDVGKATLKPGAREKLAKVAGIVMAHPDLALEVEGHTDSTGSEQTNQRLSEIRAAAAKDFLVSQGIKPTQIVSRGFGESRPVATNDTATGRQQNRRVELVISGESISPGSSIESSVR